MKGKNLQVIVLSFLLVFSCGFAEAQGFDIKGKVLAYFGTIKGWFQNSNKKQQFGSAEENLLYNIRNVEPGDFKSLVEVVFDVNYNSLPRVSGEEYRKAFACMAQKCLILNQ